MESRRYTTLHYGHKFTHKKKENSYCSQFSNKREILAAAIVVSLLVFIIHWRFSLKGTEPCRDIDDEVHTGCSNPDTSGVRRPNRGIATYNTLFFDRLRALTSRGAKSRDPELIQLIRDVIDPPELDKQLKHSQNDPITPQAAEVELLLNAKRGGFFVECGAFDGEKTSNSIYLEKERGWTGLLIEMDPFYYTQLLGRNRKAWSLNACVSPYDYVVELPFREDSGNAGAIELTNENYNDKMKTVPCFPFLSIMLALNQSHVDYFSLDVEGVELEILKTIPFNEIHIDVLSVEYSLEKNRDSMLELMESQGYRLHKDLRMPNHALYVEDLILVHKNLSTTAVNKV